MNAIECRCMNSEFNILVFGVSPMVFFGIGKGDDQKELKVEFFSPAEYWMNALPMGNGCFRGMVWGGVQSDLLQLNGTFY